MPLVVTNPVDQAGYVTPKRALEVSAGAIVPMGAVASGMTIATSAVRGTATGNAVAATIEAGVTIANLGSDGAAPAPATVDVTTGMHRGAVTQAGSTVAVMTSGSAMTFGSAMTSVTAMATAAGMSETSGNVGIAISTRTSVRRGERPRSFRSPRWDRQEHSHGRRDHERRSRHDRRPGEGRGQFRESRDFDPVEQDQMSWEATTVEVEVAENDTTSGFAELGVAAPMVAVLKQQGITEPFPIQRATIADAIAGRDVLGRGRTGSGKTLAFGLPLLTRLAADDPTGTPRAVILTPTRELALQIADNLSPLAAVMGLHLYLVAGGMAYGPQLKAFERGVDVVVATPGRLIDLLEQGAVDLSRVEVLVLDEADHMSDLGFLPAVTTILEAVPADGQRLLFSATLDGAVDALVRKHLADPVTHEVDSGKASVTTMTHHVLHMAPHHKNQATAEIANREGRTVVFARTQMGADRIARQLREAGVMAGALHGGLTQGARARILAAFKRGEVPVLVATDVAARGIHVDDISLVLQVDPPKTNKDYLHRAGRTARAGEEGIVVSILPHQRKQMRRIVGQAGVKTEPIEVTPGSDELASLTGARPCAGAPVTESDYQALIAPRPQQRRRPGGGRGRGPWRRGDRRDRGHRGERG